MKKLLSALLALAICLAIAPAALAEEAPQSRAVIGADLTEEQIAAVYSAFGVQRGQVTELKLTNQEERQYLENYVDSALIGTRSISSVYMELREEGAGMEISTSNINWCTVDMYRSALSTAGVTDARIVVAAPFAVSGTAALSGIYKAYEDMTGETLDDAAKMVGTQELTVTGELAEEIGSEDSLAIINDLKQILDVTAGMSDEEIRREITDIAGSYGVTLTDKQLSQLISLCRSMEKLDPDALRQRVEQVQETLHRVSEAKDQVVGFARTVGKIITAIRGFLDTLGDIFGK
ncbi:MAG: DUF1002 domain-containing protein [Oscillospiraceae bacterium]|nr:DUF1002 domain-containing protein [Oscillospiraceae bacterium]